MTRIWCSGMPSVNATITFKMWGIWVAEYSVISPPNGCGIASTARGLHRHRDQALLDVALADRVGGRGERLVDGTLVVLDEQVPGVARVGAEVVVDHDPVGQRVLEVDHGLERLVLHVDRFERVAGRGGAVGEHARHAVTRVARLRRGERVVRRVLHVVGDGPCARHRPAPLIGQVGSRVRRPDARDGERARHVDRRDAGVGVRAAQHREVQGAGDLDVVRELGFAGEQRGVLAPQQPLADHARRFLVQSSIRSCRGPLPFGSSVCYLPAAASTDSTMLW